MPYDYTNELEAVKKYYEGDALQQRFSALVCGETGAGKTYLARTCRKPIHIDSFDPGGTKCLLDMIEKGDVVADTKWENEDPFKPSVFEEWKKTTDRRFMIDYFSHFGTYFLDSATMFGNAAMNAQLKSKGREGDTPQHRQDYNPQKNAIETYIKKLMRLPCDFILTGHLREIKKLMRVDTKTGITTEDIKYRFYTTGQAVVTIPLLFDEIYVILGKEQRGQAPKREMLIDSLGTYIARSRLKSKGYLDAVEPPDIKAILKKAGIRWEDKEPLKGGDITATNNKE